MKQGAKGFFYRFPRITGIIVILCISLFALDTFGNGSTFWQTILGLFMHLIPSIILTIVLIVSRKYDLVGAIVFGLAGLGYIIMVSLNQSDRHLKLSRLLIIAGPVLLVGICFFLHRFHSQKHNK